MSGISTYTGRLFHPLDPKPHEIDIRDIAHALALKTRFGGHAKTFYSIAEHSVRVSRFLPPDLALWGLLHDAGEAYLADVPRPVKALIPAFVAAEENILRIIAARYGLCWPMPAAVCIADDTLLVTEARDLMACGGKDWGMTAAPLSEQIVPVTWHEAEALFLARFDELGAR